MSVSELPVFSAIALDCFESRLAALLAGHLQRIADLGSQTEPSWDSLIRPLEEMHNELEQFWSPLAHLHAVMNTPPLRQCYTACLPQLSAYETAIGQNQALYAAVKRLDRATLNPIQQKIVADHLRDFVLSGVALLPQDKKRFETISARLSSLSNQFENHVLDAVQHFQYPITEAHRLAGLPAHTIATAAARAAAQGLSGWLIGLEQPTYVAVATYADDRDLRQILYEAYVTRASDQGPDAGSFDNTAVMQEILSLRYALARLLDFPNFAALSLATKMAESCTEVNTFLQDLIAKTHPQAHAELAELKTWASTVMHVDNLEPWDIAYWSEKKKEACYAISQEALRPYFPLPKVLSGLFAILNKLYGISFAEITTADRWHPDVRCYRITDAQGLLRGYIYMDLFARAHKRGGAWMDSCQSRYLRDDGSIQFPIATLTCNFAQSEPVACLSHDEVTTFFHEFGHCLQHVLTQVDYISVSGIHGVEWDAVELPSQFFENWCWQAEAIQELTAHVVTGEPLPSNMLGQLLAAKNYHAALAMIRQLEFAQFDFRLHEVFGDQSDADLISQILAEIRKNTAVLPIVPYNRVQHSFTHIFSGGYAAGYYSYIWAEVLSCDAFARFEEEGIFAPKTGRDFLEQILEVGGSKKALDAFIAFRGRQPSIEALLRHNGIDI